MKVRVNFSAFLKDFNIEATALMTFIKVADEIKLEIDIGLFEIE